MSKYGEKVAIVGLKREKGYLYYLDKEGDISRAQMKPNRLKAERGEE
jgi:hypothetical protein